MEHPIDRAMKAAGLNTQGLAEKLGVTRAAVQQWTEEGRVVPARHCPAVERLCGGAVRCEELNNKVDWAYLRTTEPTA